MQADADQRRCANLGVARLCGMLRPFLGSTIPRTRPALVLVLTCTTAACYPRRAVMFSHRATPTSGSKPGQPIHGAPVLTSALHPLGEPDNPAGRMPRDADRSGTDRPRIRHAQTRSALVACARQK